MIFLLSKNFEVKQAYAKSGTKYPFIYASMRMFMIDLVM